MEIEVGEYVRTKNDGIQKITKIKYDEEYKENYYSFGKFFGTFENEILNHSKNLIDLIEVGDILEIGNEKYEIIYDESYEKLGILMPSRKQLAVRHCSIEYIFSKNGIEKFKNITILTKEQYNQNCYRLEE